MGAARSHTALCLLLVLMTAHCTIALQGSQAGGALPFFRRVLGEGGGGGWHGGGGGSWHGGWHGGKGYDHGGYRKGGYDHQNGYDRKKGYDRGYDHGYNRYKKDQSWG